MKPKIEAALHSSSINGNIKIHSFSKRFSVEDDC
jgi:hypothetical protein